MKPEKQLYQWDVNQYLTELQPTAEFVDYPIGNEVIRIKSDGTRCRIPDEVLQTYGGKTCYERYPDGTYRAYSFTVLYAPKPPDYVYTAEERTTFDALVAKADAAIEEIKRRADSGEFTPKKGVDYFTEEDKTEMMESVSSGAIGEFRKVVDTATTEYNANASEKLTAYDTNAEQQTTDYNRNAAEKLESYNQNHTEKVAEYNQNAETKTAEFDSNAAALQTEVDRLRGECDTLAAENRKQENRISALMKLNKGQTYDILAEEGETASRTAPSGSKYVSVDRLGGKSIVWNQLVQDGNFTEASSWTTSNATMTVSNNIATITQNSSDGYINQLVNTVRGHRCLAMVDIKGVAGKKYSLNGVIMSFISDGTWQTRTNIFTATSQITYFVIAQSGEDGFPAEWQIRNACIFDLTQMFGTTIADYIYSLEQSQAGAGVAWFNQMFPANYYPYSEPAIISSQTDRVDVASADGTITQQITTSFPVLNSAGSVYDYIDLNEGKLHQRVGVVDLGSLYWGYQAIGTSTVAPYMYTDVKKLGLKHLGGFSTKVYNIICPNYTTVARNPTSFVDKTICADGDANTVLQIQLKDSAYTDAASFKAAMSGVMLYYEPAEEVITDIDIPTELTEWLPVEAGGTVTFRNSDDTKQLPVPNAVSWVRKLDEVN